MNELCGTRKVKNKKASNQSDDGRACKPKVVNKVKECMPIDDNRACKDEKGIALKKTKQFRQESCTRKSDAN